MNNGLNDISDFKFYAVIGPDWKIIDSNPFFRKSFDNITSTSLTNIVFAEDWKLVRASIGKNVSVRLMTKGNFVCHSKVSIVELFKDSAYYHLEGIFDNDSPKHLRDQIKRQELQLKNIKNDLNHDILIHVGHIQGSVDFIAKVTTDPSVLVEVDIVKRASVNLKKSVERIMMNFK